MTRFTGSTLRPHTECSGEGTTNASASPEKRTTSRNEDGQMFRSVRSVFSPEELDALGDEMDALKAEILTASLVRG